MTSKLVGSVPIPDQAIRNAYMDRKLVPWIGAGLSSAISFSNNANDGARLPGFDGILTSLLESAANGGLVSQARQHDIAKLIKNEQFSAAAAELRPCIPPQDFADMMWKQLSTFRPRASQHHVMLNLMQFELFLTTNYDWVLDDIIRPRPKVLTYRNLETLNALITRDGKPPVQSPFIFKMNGDLSSPSTIVLGQAQQLGFTDPDSELSRSLRETLRNLMQERSILFLGYSFDAVIYRNLLIELGRELGKNCRHHFAVLPRDEADKVQNREALERDAKISFFPFELDTRAKDKDPYRAIWQFLSQIPTEGSRRNFQMRPGSVERTFFLAKDRHRYLDIQNRFEESSQVFRFLTPSLSNAVATTDFIEETAPATLAKFQNNSEIKDWDAWKDLVIDQMKTRVGTLKSRIEDGAEVRVLCLRKNTERQIKHADKSTLARFHFALELLTDSHLDVELRLMDGTMESRSLMSFASLLRANSAEQQTDIGVAYATQATDADFEAHVFEMNTDFARTMLLSFEQEWARAQPLDDSIKALKRAVLAREAELKQ